MLRRIQNGIVQRGSGYAGHLGFPTVNIPLADESLSGIYAARVTISALGGKEDPYMAAVFADPKRKILEAHILDFNDDLVGQEITIELREKIRETEIFGDEEKLRATIARDVKATRKYFKK